MIPKIWAAANMIKFSDEWSYVFYVLWVDDPRYIGYPIQYKMLVKEHCYIYNSQETYKHMFQEVAFQARRIGIKLESHLEKQEKDNVQGV